MRIRVLIVDDVSFVRSIIKEIVERFPPENVPVEWEVATAKDGQEASELMKNEPFNLVISDVDMPNMNGLELLSFVKKAYPDTLVIMMSGWAPPSLEKSLLNLGADRFLGKPFSSVKLWEVIGELVFPKGE